MLQQAIRQYNEPARLPDTVEAVETEVEQEIQIEREMDIGKEE